MHAILRFYCALSLVTLCTACSGGGSSGGGTSSLPPPPAPPASPVVEIATIGVSQLWLNWDPVGNAIEYRVYFATQAGVTPQNYMTLPNSGMEVAVTPPHNIGSLLESELYHLVVTAAGESGESAPSNEVSARPWGEVIDATIKPLARALMPGVVQWFELRGTVTGGQSRFVTERASWSSSDPAVVTIGPLVDNVQYVQARSAGNATIIAEVDGIVLNANVRVWPITMLEEGVPFSTGATVPTVGIDNTGNALAAWAYHLAGELRVYEYNDTDGWTGPTLLDSMADRVEEPMLDVAGSGMAHMVWHGLNGVYSAEYIPAQGWLATEKISSVGQEIQVATGANGSGVSIWLDPNANRIMASSFNSGVGWTVPAELGQRGSSVAAFQLVGNDNGTVVAVWQSWAMAPGDSWTLYAAIYQPGAGWGAPVTLNQQTIYMTPDTDIAEDGTIAVAWIDDSPSAGIQLSLFEPGTGWLVAEEVQAATTAVWPQVAVSDGGDVMVAWIRNGNYDLDVRHRRPGMVWDAAQTLVENAFGSRGLHLASDGAGGVVMVEVGTRTINDQPWGRIHKYVAGAGWQPEELLHAGVATLVPATIDTSPSGQTIIGWNEHYTLSDGSVSSEYEDLFVLINP